MLLFVFFTIMSLLRLFKYPKVAYIVFADFTQTSYLGAIPVAFDTIIVGIIIFYSHHETAVWAAFGLFWVAILLTSIVVFSSVFVVYHHQKDVELSDVTGAWTLTFIPMIVVAATGSSLLPYLGRSPGVVVMVVSFMAWSLGVSMSLVISTIYLWRLMKCQLPARDAIISCFVPIGPFGMGAYGIQNLAVSLATHIEKHHFVLDRGPKVPASSLAAVAESIHWIGIILAFANLGLATFWLIEAVASLWSKFPRSFNIGFWSFVFPLGVYSNAFCQLSVDLRNNGLKGFAATCVVVTASIWLLCALATVEAGILRGRLFYAPGLQGWAEGERMDKARGSSVQEPQSGHATATGGTRYEGDVANIDARTDGTYAYSRRAENALEL